MSEVTQLGANEAWAFRSALPHMQFAFKSGKIAVFQNNLFYTQNETEYKELKAEVEAGHPFISIDANEAVVDTTALTPREQLKKQLRAELMKEMAERTAVTNNFGSYDGKASPAGMVTTTTVAEANSIPAVETPVVVKADASTLAAIAAQAENDGQSGEQAPEQPAQTAEDKPTATALPTTLAKPVQVGGIIGLNLGKK